MAAPVKTRRSNNRLRVAALAAAATTWLWVFSAPTGHAADSVYWGNVASGTISRANLDGSGAANLPTPGVTPNAPEGVALDVAAGRLYWANQNGNTLSFAALDGSGAANVDTTGATMDRPRGVAVDPAGGRLYWANSFGDKISYVPLTGGGAHDLPTGTATVSAPRGVAVDPAAGRIYWANWALDAISYANLDGSGGGNINTMGAPLNDPQGVAIDINVGRIYWANEGNNTIGFARLDGSGGGPLPTGTATIHSPYGVAIDAAAGRIYWANFNGADGISFAALNGSGGASLPTPSVTPSFAAFPVLLKAPIPAGAPRITGGSSPGSRLHCLGHVWAGDVLGAFLYRAPRAFTYTWSRNGQDIAGAVGDTITARRRGEYRCRVTAQNQAGATTQLSRTVAVFSVGRPKLNRRRGTARLPVTVPTAGTLTLRGAGVVSQRAAPARPAASASITVKGAGTYKLPVKAKGAKRAKLKRTGQVKVRVTVTFTRREGTPASQRRSIRLRLRPSR